MPRDYRLKARSALQNSENLYERVLKTVQQSKKYNPALRQLVTTRRFRHILRAVSYLDDFFASSVKYLGPLRDAPKPLYPLAQSADPYDVGLRGEYTASVLELHKSQQVFYVPSAHFGTPSVNRSLFYEKVGDSSRRWLQYLGVANSVESKDRGKLGHELKVGLGVSKVKHDLTHVGVGVSQVLPILVMCLLADEDSTLVFEQPELHLHPRVQTLLADFFLSMALCGKQCIVETHSEYLIDRLRFRIAAATDDLFRSQLRVYFVEKVEDVSQFREVKVNEYGAIADWPEGFFDQSQQQAEDILKAAVTKRKRRLELSNE